MAKPPTVRLGMEPIQQLVVFSLDERVYALRLSTVSRIVPAVYIAPLPGAPEVILGVIDVGGEMAAVFDLRKRFQLPPKPLVPEDRIILARTARRPVALVVDAVHGVAEPAEQDVVAAKEIIPGLPYVEGVVTLPGGLAVIHHLDAFLGFEEARELETALAAGATDEQ